MLGAALRGERFWGVPRHFYQILLGVEALWLAALTLAAFVLAGSVYYVWAARKGRVELTSPALLAVTVAACGVAASYFLATVDHPLFHVKAADARFVAGGVFVGTAAAWVALAGGVYRLVKRVRPRAGAALSVATLRLLALVLLVPFVGAEAWSLWRPRGPGLRRPDVYVVVMDAFRADRLEAYGAGRRLAPALEDFAAGAVVFKDAYTVSSWTKPAVATIFTSTYSSTHGVNSGASTLPDEAVTLAEYMRGIGYTTIGVSANPNVNRSFGMGDGFDVLDCSASGSILEAAGPPTFSARLMTGAAVAPSFFGAAWRPVRDGLRLNRRCGLWLHLAGARPRFIYIHYMEPHTPNSPRPACKAELAPLLSRVDARRAQQLAVGEFFFAELLEDPAFRPDYDDDAVALAKALYDADIRLMDLVLKDLLENVVPDARRSPEPIFIITADHGEEFLEHGRWLHGAGLHREVAEIPLVVKVPGCPPAAVDGPVSLLDLGPTVVSLLGGTAPEGWEGLDLKPYLTAGQKVPPRLVLMEGIQIFVPGRYTKNWSRIELNGLVAGGYYYIKDEGAGTEFLYDLTLDPWQENNLALDEGFSGRRGLLSACRDTLRRLKRRAEKRAFTPGAVNISPKMEKALKALGYV
jgi:arylsulfatase A-like enzyme